MIIDFEWDIEKAVENESKHGVSFSEASETFLDSAGFALRDDKHSEIEERFYWVGRSDSGRILTTRYTKRGVKIRIIGSAEWREFRKLYYEKTKHQKS